MNGTLEEESKKVTLSRPIEVSPPDHLKIAAIIPVFNEANGIESVLEVLHQTDFVSEIIVVDDGSKDPTADKVINVMQKDARIRLIRHHQNLGKGQAIFTGRKVTQAPLLLMLT